MLTPMLYGQGRDRHGEILTQIARLVESRQLVPPLNEKRFGLEQTGEAFHHAQFGKSAGKVIIQMD